MSHKPDHCFWFSNGQSSQVSIVAFQIVMILVRWGLEYQMPWKFLWYPSVWFSNGVRFSNGVLFEKKGGHFVQNHRKYEQNGRHFVWSSNGSVLELLGP